MARKVHTVGVAESDSQGDGLGLALADIGGGIPHPAAVGADVGGELHLRDNYNAQVSNNISRHFRVRGFPHGLPRVDTYCSGWRRP